MKFVFSVLLCYTIASAIGSDEHRPKMKKETDRGKRNLEYSISHNYPIGSNFRLERRIATVPSFQFPSRYPPYFPPGPRPYIPNGKRGRPHSVPAPPYAVQMEPLVQYSQRDPLYDTSKLPLTAEANDLSKPDDLLTDNNHLSEHIYAQNYHGPPYSHHEQSYYQKEPEPIIEIIIKESNVTLPPVPAPTLPPKKKEPVQVFYVKYKKNPNGHGKDSVVYDKPVPALTPHVEESEPEPQIDQPHQEYVTAAPPATTTIRTIIRPDSEQYIGTSGIRVTFGSEHKKDHPSLEGHEESAPQPAVIFPREQPQQQAQFSQPIPERKPPTSAFPPNFNPPPNFNQPAFNPRPSTQFQNNQYRQFNHQQVRQFPNQQNQRPPGPPLRPFPPQQFPPRPLSPPQLPPQHRPQFNQPPQFPPNQFPPNHQPNLQFPTNNQFPPNSFAQFPPNQFPPTQFSSHSFHNNFPPQSPKPQFQQLLNHRPQTHFPIVQQQLPQQAQPQQFNQKPLNQPQPQQIPQQHPQQIPQHPPQLSQHQQQPQKPPQNIQFNQVQHHNHHQQQQQQQQRNNQQIQQQQNYQFHNQQLNLQQQQQINQQHLNQQQLNNHQQLNQQQLNNHQQLNQQQLNQQQLNQQQLNQQQLNQQQHLNQQHAQLQQQQNQQQLGHIIPPGGELLKSVPRYEQHISVPAESSNTQISNNANKPQALPLIQNQPQNNQFAQSQIASQNVQLNHQQQLQSLQLQQQLQQEQQQRNLQIQQQLKQQEQLLQQQKHLSQQDFQQQIQQQFQQFPQNFAQLNHVQNKQQQASLASKQENHGIQQSIPQNQQQLSQVQNFFLQNLQEQQKSVQALYNQQNHLSSAVPSSTTQKVLYQSTTQPSTTAKPQEKSEEKKKENKLPANIELPDEVPDELREQLLSSGILSNADISVLDYDKVGDIPIDALPPDQLANFYGAGGAQQLAASERKETYIKPNGEPVNDNSESIFDQELEAEASEIEEVRESVKPKSPVEMKVVHYDSATQEGKAVQDSYVRDDATQVDPVVLNDNTYNKYLPLKVSGVNFPIPDVPELKGRNITSVVVLAPVDYDFKETHEHQGERTVRDIEGDIKDVRLLAGEALKQLLKMPTTENYKKWLEKENQTASDKQSVVLLVTGSPDSKEKEIFMYDVATKTVSKLSGELSSAFVEAAESNADDDITDASEIHQTRIKLENKPSDLDAETSEILEDVVDVSINEEAADNRVKARSAFRKTG